MARNTREHILKVAFFLFLQKSFKAVTLKDIVSKAEVSKGAFYHYFESKNDLFVAVFKRYYSDFLQDNFAHLNRNSLKEFYIDALNQSQRMFKEFFQSSGKQSISKANLFLLVFEAAHRNPRFRKLVIEQGEQEINAWKKVIKDAQQSGEITNKIPAKEIAKMFIFIGDGHGIHNSFEKRSGQFDIVETRKLYDNLYELLK